MEKNKEDKGKEGLRIEVLARYAGSQIKVEQVRPGIELCLTGFKANASMVKITGFRDDIRLGGKKVNGLDILIGQHNESEEIGCAFFMRMESGEVIRVEPKPSSINALFFKTPQSPKAAVSGNIIYPWLFPD